MSDQILDHTIRGLNAALNFRITQQGVITSNIANADTPGYHAKKFEFENALREAFRTEEYMPLETSDPDHFTKYQPGSVMAEIYENPNGVVNSDGNSVDRNAEQVALAENQIHYDAGAEILKRKLALLKYAVTEGGGR